MEQGWRGRPDQQRENKARHQGRRTKSRHQRAGEDGLPAVAAPGVGNRGCGMRRAAGGSDRGRDGRSRTTTGMGRATDGTNGRGRTCLDRLDHEGAVFLGVGSQLLLQRGQVVVRHHVKVGHLGPEACGPTHAASAADALPLALGRLSAMPQHPSLKHKGCIVRGGTGRGHAVGKRLCGVSTSVQDVFCFRNTCIGRGVGGGGHGSEGAAPEILSREQDTSLVVGDFLQNAS